MHVMNDISCDVHGSSNMNFYYCIPASAVSMLQILFEQNIAIVSDWSEEKKMAHVCSTFLCLGCCRSLMCFYFSKKEITHTKSTVHYLQSMLNTYSKFIYCPIKAEKKLWTSRVCALLMHFCNEIYRFIVDTSHDFLRVHARAFVYSAFEPTTIERRRIKTHSIDSNGHTRKFIRNVYVWFPLCVMAVLAAHNVVILNSDAMCGNR